MNKKAIDLLEKARFELPILSTNIPTRKLIGEVLDLLEQQPTGELKEKVEQPTTGEFTKKIYEKWSFAPKHTKDPRLTLALIDLLEACDRLDRLDRLDRAEARVKDLLEACEGLMEKADNGSADFDDPVLGSIYLKAKATIAKAKQVQKEG